MRKLGTQSLLGSLSASRAGEITEADRAVLTLKTQRRKLANEQKRLEGLVAREMGVARELVAKRQKVRPVHCVIASAVGCERRPS